MQIPEKQEKLRDEYRFQVGFCYIGGTDGSGLVEGDEGFFYSPIWLLVTTSNCSFWASQIRIRILLSQVRYGSGCGSGSFPFPIKMFRGLK